MNLALAQRQIALAGVTLLAALVALGANTPRTSGPNLPKPVPAPGGGWYKALAASHGKSFAGSRTPECRYQIDKRSLGIAHPTLPCNTKIYLLFKGQQVLTQVIASGRKAVAPGHEFELTPALAAEIGLKKTQPIKWRYAR